MLRRTFATMSLDNGAELQHVQELMGYQDPRTTLRHYARQRSMKVAAEAHRGFSPVDRVMNGGKS